MSEQRADHNAERALLAACLESPLARKDARTHLTATDFDDPRHEDIWAAMVALDRHGKQVDAITLLATLTAGTPAADLLPAIVTTIGLPDNVREYVDIVRGWSIRRRLEAEARHVAQVALAPGRNPTTLAAEVATRFAAIRDGSAAGEDVTGKFLGELLEEDDDEPDWLIPGLMERRDRLMLTGEEGLGKSHTLRQIALHAACGLDPFEPYARPRYEPRKAAIIDCENTWNQVRRKIRPAAEWVRQTSGVDPAARIVVDCTSRMDITRDRDLAHIHRLIDAGQPDVVVIGPLYRLVPRALQTDDDTAPVLAALDTIRDRGCAVLIEAHAGHALGKGGLRDLRPRGSSSLLGWPEFGYGMRGIGAVGYCDLVPWRGNREEREWPDRLRRADGFRWVPHSDLYGWNEGGETA